MARSAGDEIERVVKDHAVVLFMKGTPLVPSCGLSAAAIRILERRKIAFEPVDVSRDAALLQALVDHSGWPTVPQLFAHGRLVAGIDLLRLLDEENALEQALAAPGDAPAVPTS
jgi:monothiol glutaredoxin